MYLWPEDFCHSGKFHTVISTNIISVIFSFSLTLSITMLNIEILKIFLEMEIFHFHLEFQVELPAPGTEPLESYLWLTVLLLLKIQTPRKSILSFATHLHFQGNKCVYSFPGGRVRGEKQFSWWEEFPRMSWIYR